MSVTLTTSEAKYVLAALLTSDDQGSLTEALVAKIGEALFGETRIFLSPEDAQSLRVEAYREKWSAEAV